MPEMAAVQVFPVATGMCMTLAFLACASKRPAAKCAFFILRCVPSTGGWLLVGVCQLLPEVFCDIDGRCCQNCALCTT